MSRTRERVAASALLTKRRSSEDKDACRFFTQCVIESDRLHRHVATISSDDVALQSASSGGSSTCRHVSAIGSDHIGRLPSSPRKRDKTRGALPATCHVA